MTLEGDRFAKTFRPSPHTCFLLLLLTFFSSSFSWKDSNLHFSIHCKGEKLSDCWICHQNLQSVHDVGDPLVSPITDFSLVSNAIINYTCNFLGVTFQVRLLEPGVPVPCSQPFSNHNHTNSAEHLYLYKLYNICLPLHVLFPI